jgi:hypothetical protein
MIDDQKMFLYMDDLDVVVDDELDMDDYYNQLIEDE